MPFIAPFKGLRYNPRKVGSLARVVTPPYDVISPGGQAQYYRRHRWNFVRVVFGKVYPGDHGNENRYSRARRTLEEWIRDRILNPDSVPSVYPYLQEFRVSGRICRRWGVIALVRLDSRRICPHEETREGPKKDRLRLLESVEASLSPIFGLIPDPKRTYEGFVVRACSARRPVAEVTTEGVRHRLWRISDPRWVQRLQAFLRARDLVIADGHHRYEAAVTYRNRRRRQDPSYTPTAPYNFAMFYLAAAGSEDPGLLPTHRVVHRVASERLKRLIRQMVALNIARPVRNWVALLSRLQELRDKGRVALGLYTGNGAGILLEAEAGSSYQLDVEWLHQEILPQWVGVEREVSYTQDLAWARRLVQRKSARALFVVQPPRLQTVFARARSARRMPGKTTYFYPKPLAGLVEYVWGQVLDLSPGSNPFRAKGV